jgi:hypothetical protein
MEGLSRVRRELAAVRYCSKGRSIRVGTERRSYGERVRLNVGSRIGQTDVGQRPRRDCYLRRSTL